MEWGEVTEKIARLEKENHELKEEAQKYREKSYSLSTTVHELGRQNDKLLAIIEHLAKGVGR